MGKKIIIFLKKLINSFLDVLYPEKENCIICDCDGFIAICPYCESKIKKVYVQENTFSYGYYGNVLKRLILAFKYEKNFTAGKILSQFLAKLIENNDLKGDVICFVPISKKGKKKRGFNQCEILAKNLSDIFNIPVSNCLKKIKENKEQKTLTKEERMKNVQNIFVVDNKKYIENKIVILVDDVITTGATLNECKKVLQNSNAKEIIVLTIAKSNI